MSTLKIEELNVNDDVKTSLKKSNIDEANRLQEKLISNLTEGQGLIVKPDVEEKLKTIAITALGVSSEPDNHGGTKCLILSPPQNDQAIQEQINRVGSADLSCSTLDGQTTAQQKKTTLSEEPDILVATPEALQKTMRKLRYVFRDVNYIILDGLDSMVSDEDRHFLKRIRLRTLSDYTSLIFASELGEQVKETCSRYIPEPVVIGFNKTVDGQIKPVPDLSSNLKQGYINVPPRMKISTLLAFIQKSPPQQTAIFTASKRGTDRLYKALSQQNMKAASIHSRLSEGKRSQRLGRFMSGKASYLVVADISASEMDLNDIGQVINYDVPGKTDEYRFRAALLRESGANGIVSLVSEQDRDDINELQNELKTDLKELNLPASVQKKLQNRKKKSDKKDEMELPRPTYDKLSGGRSGNHDEDKNGIVHVFKKFFTS